MYIENFVIVGSHLLLGPGSEKHDVTIRFSQLLVRKHNRMQSGKTFCFLEIAAASRTVQWCWGEVLRISCLCSFHVVAFLAVKKQILNNRCFCSCFSGLPNPALQALCKLITASETGEQLINRVSWEVFQGWNSKLTCLYEWKSVSRREKCRYVSWLRSLRSPHSVTEVKTWIPTAVREKQNARNEWQNH